MTEGSGVRIRTSELWLTDPDPGGQKNMDHRDPDPDSQHWKLEENCQ